MILSNIPYIGGSRVNNSNYWNMVVIVTRRMLRLFHELIDDVETYEESRLGKTKWKTGETALSQIMIT